MSIYTEQIDTLDIKIFDAIKSQTSEGDRLSLLAVQRATARIHAEFSYLEIGSYLGGSIQPYLLDDRCKKIYSIDPRPSQHSDDRSPEYVPYYEDNSSETMLDNLKGIGHGDIGKIECIDSDASEIDPTLIKNAPEIAFIDGEHTKAAVLSDFRFCEQVVSSSGTIVFHDFSIIYPSILDACKYLRKKSCKFIALKLENDIFAIFFDIERIRLDPYLLYFYRTNRHFVKMFQIKIQLKRILPNNAIHVLRAIRNLLAGKTAMAPKNRTM